MLLSTNSQFTDRFGILLPQLIALDMDGTLLDGNGQLPPDFAAISTRAHQLGVTLVPASGRQLATLQEMFPQEDTFIAENGSVVVHDNRVISATTLPTAAVRAAVATLRTVDAAHTVVLCTPDTAYVHKGADEQARAEISKYYKAVQWVDDLDALLDADIIKIAVYCADGSEKHLHQPLLAAVPEHNIAISGAVWLDVMAAGVNKGEALHTMAELLAVPISRTAAFGDFLNDYELLREAGTAIAMENAHPKLKEMADRIAPPNTEYGVMTVLRQLFDSEES
ncbi:HAD family hydrolase [Corynebacterium yonathiae]|uniref:HAD family hydrolase n=1 Tax=Corynebacterium yonathiae TaxID=2913504 RepID=A0A9X3LYV2_9CORY|nr:MULTISPECIES: HAD family hydrolase [Corynebacterium]MCZ9296514.1 HAD family hydrolase [Corynebacterium yonathiae]MDK2583659.1 HAD family hydrolase [Corynebacterium sp. BWA136]